MNLDELKIEKGIPIPPHRGAASGHKNLIESMKPGDSVLLPKGKNTGSFRNYAKNGIKITFRTTPEGIRMWRVK